MKTNEIYYPVSQYLMDWRGDIHACYEADLVKYAAIVDNKYGVEVLQGRGKYSIMNVFSLNNGELLDGMWVSLHGTRQHYDNLASFLIDEIESFKTTN